MRCMGMTAGCLWGLAFCMALPGYGFAQCSYGWFPGEGLPGLDGTVYTMTVWDDGRGPALYVGGWFKFAGRTNANSVARWDGHSWEPMGQEMEYVGALAVYGGQLIAGNSITTADYRHLGSLTVWDGVAWHGVGGELTGPGYDRVIQSIAVWGESVVVSGNIGMAGDVPVNNVARWNGNAWEAMGSTGGGALTVYNNQVIAVAGTVSRWNGFSWDNLNCPVSAAAPFVYQGCLYVGGDGVARWNGSTWEVVGTLDYAGTVSALCEYNGQLIAAGHFTTIGGQDAAHIARWDGSTWQPVEDGPNSDPYPKIQALAVYGNQLVAGGYFTRAGTVAASNVAGWDGSTWTSLGQGNPVSIRATTVHNGELIGAGEFSLGSVHLKGLARWDGTVWQPIAGSEVAGYSSSTVSALTTYEGDLVAGGDFTSIGGTAARNIARWDGSAWQPLENGPSGRVSSLTIYRGQLTAGGTFGVATWNGAAWQQLGGRFGTVAHAMAGVLAFCEYGGDLIAGGDFMTVQLDANPRNRISVPGIARWDGSQWRSMGSGMSTADYPGKVNALTLWDGKLIAGGYFVAAGGVSANNIAQWDGSGWAALGSGMEPMPGYLSAVSALAIYNDELVAGGAFIRAGDTVVKGIARWDRTKWQPLGDGVAGWSPVVSRIAVCDGKLIVTGDFTSAGGQASAYFARWGAMGASEVSADFDGDCDVDAGDLTIWAACASGPGIAYDPTHLPAGCTITPNVSGLIAADFDADGDVDQSDFGWLQRCYGGDGRIADATCAD